MIMHFKRQWSVYLWYLIIFIGLIITILPFWWGVAASFKSNSEIFRDLAPINIRAFSWFSLESYFAIFENDFGRSMLNTFLFHNLCCWWLLINSWPVCIRQFRFKGDNIIFGLFFYLLQYQLMQLQFLCLK